jgi:hypothetical protein
MGRKAARQPFLNLPLPEEPPSDEETSDEEFDDYSSYSSEDEYSEDEQSDSESSAAGPSSCHDASTSATSLPMDRDDSPVVLQESSQAARGAEELEVRIGRPGVNGP